MNRVITAGLMIILLMVGCAPSSRSLSGQAFYVRRLDIVVPAGGGEDAIITSRPSKIDLSGGTFSFYPLSLESDNVQSRRWHLRFSVNIVNDATVEVAAPRSLWFDRRVSERDRDVLREVIRGYKAVRIPRGVWVRFMTIGLPGGAGDSNWEIWWGNGEPP